MTTKQAYQQKIEAQLKEWQADLDKLRARADKAKAEAKLEYQQQLKELSVKQQTARQKLEALKQAGNEGWQDFRAGVDNAMADLRKSFDRL